ncbi:MAG TPA: hypothetical protein VHM29_10710, partial [Acidimicrobiia bacterium]|nr:hypothetical protein [Acidimicrobiia bacterium]
MPRRQARVAVHRVRFGGVCHLGHVGLQLRLIKRDLPARASSNTTRSWPVSRVRSIEANTTES